MNNIPKLTREQAAILGAFFGISCGPFGDLHEYAQKKLGRPIFTHEFASELLWEQLNGAAKDDFLSICFDGGS